jgi:hypothetical protein
MKLHRLTSLPERLQCVRQDGVDYHVGKVYEVEPKRFAGVQVGDHSRSYAHGPSGPWQVHDPRPRFADIRERWEQAGDLPNPAAPTNLAEVVVYCDAWLEFRYGPLWPELGQPADIQQRMIKTLHNAVREIQDRPVLPIDLQQLGDPWERLRVYRDWAHDRQSAGSRDNQEAKTAEQQMAQVAEAVGDSIAGKVLTVAKQTDLNADQKMRAIAALDIRYKGKKSPEWGKLLGVDSAAIRQLPTWKEWQKERKAD